MRRTIAVAILISWPLHLLCTITQARRLNGCVSEAAQSELRFGESLTISDLDGDDLVDSASLWGAGVRKSIRVSLSRNGENPVLEFDSLTLCRGSLIARDIDSDGDVDLIWTDLVHPELVVLWLNLGLGRFEKAHSCPNAERFTLGQKTALSSHHLEQDNTPALPRDPSRDCIVGEKPDVLTSPSVLSLPLELISNRTGATRPLSARDPPYKSASISVRV